MSQPEVTRCRGRLLVLPKANGECRPRFTTEEESTFPLGSGRKELNHPSPMLDAMFSWGQTLGSVFGGDSQTEDLEQRPNTQ